MAVLALGIGWLLSLWKPPEVRQIPWALAWGGAATLPLLAGFFLLRATPWEPLKRINRFLHHHLGPALAACHWSELAGVALLAGLGEELLFRGVLQPLWGIGIASLIFGLAHAVTPTYAVLAGLIGLYLGGLLDATGSLIAPVITHALYDFVAFLWVARDVRVQTSQ